MLLQDGLLRQCLRQQVEEGDEEEAAGLWHTKLLQRMYRQQIEEMDDIRRSDWKRLP